ncbi:hypothetical protein ACJJTC_014361 [Scirpophaga incertulas]
MYVNHLRKGYKGICKYMALVCTTGLLIFYCMTIINTTTDLYIIPWNMTEDISCHYSDVGNVLPVLDNQFSPPDKSIFFLETACRGGLSSRQACAVESAARHHPNWNVHVFFSGPVTDLVLKRSCLATLLTYNNVKLLRIHIKDYANNTPLESMVSASPYSRSKWRIEHSSDVLRYLTLYKYGGVYMDSDVVVVKPLDSLANNWAARESPWAVDAGALSFSRDSLGRKVANASIEDFKRNYKPKVWGNNGPGVITRVLKKMCKGKKNKWNQGCNGFKVYEPALFYPVYYKKNRLYFKAGAKLPYGNKPFVHHLWNAFTRNYKIPKGSPYDTLAKNHCPAIYTLYRDRFGI